MEARLREIDRERISRLEADELDRLVAAGDIREMDRDAVSGAVNSVENDTEECIQPISDDPAGRERHSGHIGSG
jgi:hypothetical protein